jgi:hypothetical protein
MEICTIDTGILTVCHRHMITSTKLGLPGPLRPEGDMASREEVRPMPATARSISRPPGSEGAAGRVT